MSIAPTLSEITAAAEYLEPFLRKTPVLSLNKEELPSPLLAPTTLHLKLELFQHGGSFKLRGVLLNLAKLSSQQLKRGVTAASGGNHAIAVALGAHLLGISAKVVIPKTANPLRQAFCRRYGAELVLVDDIKQVFVEAQRIAEQEGRTFIHPFDGFNVSLGTATLGQEFLQQVPQLDAVVVAIGGGGLCSGIAAAVKQAAPHIEVYGVEPVGADAMSRSFACGSPQRLDKIATIADSLSAPYTEQYSFELCQQYVDDLVQVSDEELIQSMRWLADNNKLIVEPAGAAALAAVCGPLISRLQGLQVGILVCGSNIDVATFYRYVQ